MSEVSLERRTMNVKKYCVLGDDRKGLSCWDSSGKNICFEVTDNDLALLQDELRPRIDRFWCYVTKNASYPTNCDFLKEFSVTLDVDNSLDHRNAVFTIGSKKFKSDKYGDGHKDKLSGAFKSITFEGVAYIADGCIASNLDPLLFSLGLVSFLVDSKNASIIKNASSEVECYAISEPEYGRGALPREFTHVVPVVISKAFNTEECREAFDAADIKPGDLVKVKCEIRGVKTPEGKQLVCCCLTYICQDNSKTVDITGFYSSKHVFNDVLLKADGSLLSN